MITPTVDAAAGSRSRAVAELAGALMEHVNPGGGWGYYGGKTSRLEPTCWAIHALGERNASLETHRLFFDRCRRPDGLFVDLPKAPPNYAYNGLALLTAQNRPALTTPKTVESSVTTLAAATGLRSDPLPVIRQDNMLEGWAWMDGMSSWVEPTSWCLMALKRLPASGRQPAVVHRIGEGEKLLIDRCCESGGWNYGNSNVLGTNLPAYVPTTAIALMALQDRRDLPIVGRSLAYLVRYSTRERSGMALSLALMCLRLYQQGDADVANVQTALIDQWQRTRFLGNLCATAMALYALDFDPDAAGGLKI